MGLFSQGKWRLFDWFVLCAVVGIGLAIILPNFVKARVSNGRSQCVMQLRMIRMGVEQWALENKKAPTDTYDLSDPMIQAYLKGSVLPACPRGGRYAPGTNFADRPKCSLGGPGHTL